jgi:hypothetical protein
VVKDDDLVFNSADYIVVILVVDYDLFAFVFVAVYVCVASVFDAVVFIAGIVAIDVVVFIDSFTSMLDFCVSIVAVALLDVASYVVVDITVSDDDDLVDAVGGVSISSLMLLLLWS